MSSMKQKVVVNQQGIGFLGLLTILFAACKLFGVIDWSWWLVLLPVWILPAVLLGLGVFAAVVWLILVAIQAHNEKKRYRRRVRGGS